MSFFSRFSFENIIQTVVNFSVVDIKYVKITEPREDSFLFSLEAQVYRTGPVYATVSAMTVDLAGPTGIYGKLSMDEFKITPTETKIVIKDQIVKITNVDNFIALSRTLVQQETAHFSLVNGQGTVKVLGITFPMKFSKTCPVPGMAGPRTEFLSVTDGDEKVIAKIYNPSPMEMDMGNAVFECRNSDGVAIARQKGHVWITPGESTHEVTLEVIVREGMSSAGDVSKLRLVGVDIDVDTNSWMKLGIKNYDVELPLTSELSALIRRKEREALDARAAAEVEKEAS